jgi:acyl carrier protein
MADRKPPGATVPDVPDVNVLERLRALAREELEMKPDDVARVGPETQLVEGLELDSLRQVVLITRIEEQFGFELTHDDRERLLSLRTIGDLVRLIQERVPLDREWH